MTQALIVIDMQQGLENDQKKLFRKEAVLDQINQRIHFYRKQNWPILFVQHEDEELRYNQEKWQLFDTLQYKESDIFIRKTHANSFYLTNLKEVLDELAINELEFCGAQTEYCVDTTLRMAHGLGYQCFMKQGATTTVDSNLLSAKLIVAHHESIWENRFLKFS